jgi:catechol 2,3-dioxygenase-like lactoylglutathione lyase family enzyme
MTARLHTARLHHAHIFASDIEATLGFYRKWFDAEVVADELLAGSRNVMVAIGDGRLNIYDQAPANATRGGGVHHLGMQVRDVAALVERMTAGGVSFRKPVGEGEGFRYVMVEAPDQILLEVFEAVVDTMPPAARRWFDWPE